MGHIQVKGNALRRGSRDFQGGQKQFAAQTKLTLSFHTSCFKSCHLYVNRPEMGQTKGEREKKKVHLKINHPEDGASTLLARLHPADVRSSIYFHRVASCALSPSAGGGGGDVREFPTTDACAMDVFEMFFLFFFSLYSYCGEP